MPFITEGMVPEKPEPMQKPELPKKEFPSGKSHDDIFKGRSQVSMREIKRNLEGHSGTQELRKELAHELHIANQWDPRVSHQIEEIEHEIKDISGDGFINHREAEKVLGEKPYGFAQSSHYLEKKHAREDRMSDNKITLDERRERDKYAPARHGFLKRLFGRDKK